MGVCLRGNGHTYYGKNGTAPNKLANWGTTSGGTGTHPANFTTADDILIIEKTQGNSVVKI